MNAHESEKMAGILDKNGFSPAQSKEDADLILLNTCCIRESAEKKIMGNIGALKNLKTAIYSLPSVTKAQQNLALFANIEKFSK